MTNRQAKALARQLPFDFTGRTLKHRPDVLLGLKRIAAKQLRRVNQTSEERSSKRVHLQALLGAL